MSSGHSRLIYGYAGGRQHGPRRTALAVAVARQIDLAMGRLGLAQPRLLVSGFWRSGTTWLQECLAETLGAKTVFEPLAPMQRECLAYLKQLYPDDSEDLRQATIHGPQPQDSSFWTYLDGPCRGRVATTYLMGCRQTVAESLRRAIVVKDVRLQANLAGFHQRYGTPIVHMRRHPGAVVASLVAADWHWSFARVRLGTFLARLAPGLSNADHATILQHDTDMLSRTAAIWALTEKLAAAALQGQPWGIVVCYEQFAAEPDRVLAQICASLALKRHRSVDFTLPSASVDPSIFAAYGSTPQDRWRNQLSKPEIGRIEAVADALFPNWRNDTFGCSP